MIMKKILSTCAAAVLALGMLAGCGKSDALVQQESPKTESGFIFTQETAVSKEKYLKDSKVKDFVERAEKKYLIPGLNQAVIPQGMDYSEKTGLIYISGYYKLDNMPSVIMAVDAVSGEFCAEYRLFKEDGSPFVSHVGGVAITENSLYVSGSSDKEGNYSIGVIPLDELPVSGSCDITIKTFIGSAVSPSFLNCSGGYLWVGNFYYPAADYTLSPEMNYTVSADGEEYGCYILGFRTANSDITEYEGEYPIPDIVLAVTDRIQGMVISEDGGIYLSQSYGRKNYSTLFRYEADLNAPETEVDISGIKVPAVILDRSRMTEALTAMPMTEALCNGSSGEVLVLFESGAINYSDGKDRTDHIWTIDLN